MSDKTLFDTARHEAGHIVAAWYVGQIVYGVSISPDSTYTDSHGRVLQIGDEGGERQGTMDVGGLYQPFFTQIAKCTAAAAEAAGTDEMWHEHVRLMYIGARRDLIVLLAGGIAGAGYPKMSGDTCLDAGAESDLEHARKIAALLPEGLDAMAPAVAATKMMLREHWPTVKAVANALVQHLTMDDKQILAVIQSVTGEGWRERMCPLDEPMRWTDGAVWPLNP